MKILVVDDSQMMRMLVVRTLKQAELGELEIQEAINGRDALAKIAAGGMPDLILSDWNMPEVNGLQLLKTIRETDKTVRFGFVTTEGTGPMRTIAAAAGAEFVIVKPFTAKDFRAVVPKPSGAAATPAASGPAQASGAAVPSVDYSFAPSAEVTHVLFSLIKKQISIKPDAPLTLGDAKAVAVYRMDGSPFMLACVCSLPLCASVGAALSLLSASTVQEAIASRTVPEAMRKNAVDVFNVFASMIEPKASAHFVQSAVYWPGTPVPKEVSSLVLQAKKRLDIHIDVEDYGGGKLSLLLCPSA